MATTTIGRLHDRVDSARPAQRVEATRFNLGLALAFSTRALLVLTAVFFVAIGVMTLTGPLAVPFTITMFLGAATFAGLAAFWELPEN